MHLYLPTLCIASADVVDEGTIYSPRWCSRLLMIQSAISSDSTIHKLDGAKLSKDCTELQT